MEVISDAKPPRAGVQLSRLLPLTDDGQRAELYRIAEDRAEAHNLAAQHPDLVARLGGKLDEWKATLPKAPPAEFISKKRRNAKTTADEL